MGGMKQVAYFGVSTLVLKGLGFALLPISTRLLNQNQFGELNFLVSISAVLSLLLCLGLPELLFKQQTKTLIEKKALFRDCFVICAGFNCIFILLSFIFIDKLTALLPITINPFDLKLLILNLAASSLLSIIFCYFRYYEMAKQFCCLAILQGVGQTLLTVYLLWLGYGVTGVMVSGAICSSLILLVALNIVIKEVSVSFTNVKWSVSGSSSLFLLSIVVSSLFVYANNGAENWFIVAKTSKETLAQYYVALQFAVMTSFTFEPVRMWWFARRFNELKADKERYVYLCELSLEIGLVLCAIMLILAPIVFTLILPLSYQSNTWLLPTLILIVALRHHSDLLNIGCFIHRNALFVTLNNGASALIVLGLLALLVPSFGVLGAVIALLIAQVFKACMFFYFSQNLEPLDFSAKRLTTSWVSFISLYGVSIYHFSHQLVLQLVIMVIYLFFFYKKYRVEVQRFITQYRGTAAHV